MLNLASPTPRTDIMKAFDKKFQIPKLSARGKSDDKPAVDDSQNFNSHPRSAPTTPIQSLTPSPTMDFMREGTSGSQNQYQMGHQKFFNNVGHQQNKFIDQQRQNKKLFKSVSSEQLLFGDETEKQSVADKIRVQGDVDFQAFLRAQSKMSEPSSAMHIMKSPMNQNGMDGNMMQGDAGNVFNDDDLMDLNFIGNEI
jgi:hypothetical protein